MFKSATFSIAVLAITALLTISPPVFAGGSAVFASVTNEREKERLSAELEAQLGTTINTSTAWVDGTKWTRLSSGVLSESDARALVARAKKKGYQAWYNSEGNRWAESAEEAPASDSVTRRSTGAQRVSNTDSDDIDTSNLGIVTPATGDVSHLPMAETFPIE